MFTPKERARILRLAGKKLGLSANKGLHVLAEKAGRIEGTRAKTKAEQWRLLRRLAGDEALPVVAKAARAYAPVVVDVASDSFLSSYAWRRVRMEALKLHGARCQCCGATPKDGITIHVDHIKPRRLFPALALDVKNLQVLCEVCNHGKGNWDQTDWRPRNEKFKVEPEDIRWLLTDDKGPM